MQTKAYYDPYIFMSTSEFPNTMGITIVLKEKVDGGILKEAVEELRSRFPYFYVRVKVEGNDLITVPNDLPVVVRDTWDPIHLFSEEANYHLMAFKYEGDRLAVEISHAVTDGAGLLPYIKSVLYCYLCRKTGKIFDRDGFRLPGDTIPETEIGDPFPGLDVDGAEAPLYQKPPITDYFRLRDISEGYGDERVFYLQLPEAEVMRYCKENDGSPNVLVSVLLTKAVQRIAPENEKTITSIIALDHKAMLGNHDNYRMFANTAIIDFPGNETQDIMKMCTAGRGMLMLQAQPENSLFYLKTRKAGFARMSAIPLQAKADMIKPAVSNPRATVSVSYANSRSFGPLDEFIKEVYVLGQTGVTDVLCEISCINHSFFLSFLQGFSSDLYFKAFLQELESAGIHSHIMGDEPIRLCGVRYDGIEGVSL